LALIYLFASRFVHDAVLLPVALIFLLIGSVRVNRLGLTCVALACILLPLQVLIHGGLLDSPGQIAHLIGLLLVFTALDDLHFNPSVLESFCRLTTILNIALLALSWVPAVAAVTFWTDANGGSARFQSVLPEPSFAALYSTLNFFVLIRSRHKRYAYANLLPLFLTFSFSGILGFIALATVYLRQSWRLIIGGVATMLIVVAAAYTVAPATISSLLVERAANEAFGSGDDSVRLRIFAPIDLVRNMSGEADDVTFATGIGVGNVERYIYYKQSALPNYWRGTGKRSTEPDSVIAFVVAAFGIPAAIIIGLLVLTLVSRPIVVPAFSVARVFLILMCIFSGLFISAHFFVWIFLLRQEKRFAEDSAVGPQATVSGR
jgi:hypothetical protein